MGGTTAAPWLIPYPTGGDLVRDGDNAMQAIAERVAALLTANVGVPYVPLGTNGVVMTWGGTVQIATRSGWVWVLLNPTKTSWTSGETIATLPAGYRPVSSVYASCIVAASAAATSVLLTSGGLLQTVGAVTSGGGLVGAFSFIPA